MNDNKTIVNAEDFNAEKIIKEQKRIFQYYLETMGPKFCHRKKLNEDEGWRIGFTKPTIEKRREERRKKNKLVRKARKMSKK
jgi:hypothetical protein